MENLKTVKGKGLTFFFGIEQGSQEWLDLRKGRVTCSNAQLLLAKGPRACLDENLRAAERTTVNGNSYADRGHVIEDEMREQLNASLREQGMEIKTCTFITNDKYPLAGYSPDGLIVPIDDEKWVERDDYIPVEFKAYNDITENIKGEKNKVMKHARACQDYDEVPLYARLQVQMEMMMCNAKELFLVLANPDAEEGVPKVKVWHVERNENVVKRLEEKLKDFAQKEEESIDKKKVV